MSGTSVAICNISHGHWYPRGAARLINEFHAVSDGYRIQSWVNTYPNSAEGVLRYARCHGLAEIGYCLKPFAVLDAAYSAQIVILLDSSFYPIKHISPLVNYVALHGFYAARDGFTVGQWANDEALAALNVSREEALKWPGLASGCVGFDTRRPEIKDLIESWADHWKLFRGYHSNDRAGDKSFQGRTIGRCSDDPRCLGHRNDQSVLSILLNQRGLVSAPAPSFWAYKHCGEDWPIHFKKNKDTLLLCEGGI